MKSVINSKHCTYDVVKYLESDICSAYVSQSICENAKNFNREQY